MGKMQLVEDLEARIRDKQEYKASRQALHLREEQESLPPEIQWVNSMGLICRATNATPAQKTRICNVCGGMLSIFDVEQYVCVVGFYIDVLQITSRESRMLLFSLFERS